MDLQTLVETENGPVIDAIVRSLRSPTGVIPFIGAGMSHDYDVPMWGEFLEIAAVTDEEKAEVKRLVGDGKYEDAAQFLDTGERSKDFAR